MRLLRIATKAVAAADADLRARWALGRLSCGRFRAGGARVLQRHVRGKLMSRWHAGADTGWPAGLGDDVAATIAVLPWYGRWRGRDILAQGPLVTVEGSLLKRASTRNVRLRNVARNRNTK